MAEVGGQCPPVPARGAGPDLSHIFACHSRCLLLRLLTASLPAVAARPCHLKQEWQVPTQPVGKTEARGGAGPAPKPSLDLRLGVRQQRRCRGGECPPWPACRPYRSSEHRWYRKSLEEEPEVRVNLIGDQRAGIGQRSPKR